VIVGPFQFDGPVRPIPFFTGHRQVGLARFATPNQNALIVLRPWLNEYNSISVDFKMYLIC